MLKPDHLPDKVGGPKTTDMVGRTFEYQYPTGPQYRISFSQELVYFTVPPLPDGTEVVALPYQQRQIRPDLFLVHWIGPGRQGHVALVFDLEQKKVDCAALMPAGLYELFDRAVFREVYENGNSALYLPYE
ncbi:hypothetical protein N7494_010099 [Penicillium frequentans]|uniref:Molybdenum cofactor biosynthesis protein F N-terminal domain-containing protein n=1 Tax=Penicillium frequentans TaxID=3151616 RepID=A0AAD6CR59_9EURO|nr:hypothetical protein N7494_010099 [Penicillium glabrum]